MDNKQFLIDLSKLTDGEKTEMKKLGIISDDSQLLEFVNPQIHIRSSSD